MLYPELEKFLEANHFYFKKEITVGKGGEVVTGLVQYCAPIIHSMRLDRLKEVLPEGFRVDWNVSKSEIKITKIE